MKYFDNLNHLNLAARNVVGVDETGVGDYFTPLIAAAAFLPTHLTEWAKKIGVKDSKKLSQKQINEIAPILINTIPHSVYTLTQSGYNSLSKVYNANEMKFFAHQKAINLLVDRYNLRVNHDIDLIVIDQYSTTNSILKYDNKILKLNNWAKLQDYEIDALLINKAEEVHLSVACASIIARYTLNLKMQEQSQKWNFDFPLGASSKTKEAVNEFTLKFGEKALGEVAKLNFKK
ncbi:hypothetical protein VO56_01945 [Mycoplasmopsis gallinacea]|uniref:Ribonuclease n=1 Tax=Mycoplasmopsis gallinacea TaxID=29556 RepID=A0A0D5ZJR4_9BACT|nr:hypothetical protein VO56_01945 [Mycoplasmopsis gallinacea]